MRTVVRRHTGLPADLWGANCPIERAPEDRTEDRSSINIRPARGNPGMEIQDAAIRERIRALTPSLIRVGEAAAP